MSIMQDLVFAKTQQEFEEIVQLFPSDTVLQKYSLYKEYLNKAIDRRKEGMGTFLQRKSENTRQ